MITEPYSLFARIYDKVMSYVDYENWFEYIRDLSVFYGLETTRILDIGAGTGSLAYYFSEAGYQIDLLDKSREMVREAEKKNYPGKPLFFCEDVLSWISGPRYSLVLSLHDTVNYLKDQDELNQFFKQASSFLAPEGALIIDNATEYNVLTHFHNSTRVYHYEGWRMKWDNLYNPSQRQLKISLTFTDKKTSPVSVFKESHVQNIFHKNDIIKAASPYFVLLADLDGFSFETSHEKTCEEYFIFKKKIFQ